MSKLSGLRYFHMCWMAKPVEDRLIYKKIKKQSVKSIVEIGMGDGNRSEKMIQVCQKFSSDQQVRYTGIDLFESRPESETQISLLAMHKRLNKTGAKVKLIPGDPESATARVANSLAGTDMILLTCDQSTLLVREADKFRVLTKKDWVQWTEKQSKSARAA